MRAQIQREVYSMNISVFQYFWGYEQVFSNLSTVHCTASKHWMSRTELREALRIRRELKFKEKHTRGLAREKSRSKVATMGWNNFWMSIFTFNNGNSTEQPRFKSSVIIRLLQKSHKIVHLQTKWEVFHSKYCRVASSNARY